MSKLTILLNALLRGNVWSYKRARGESTLCIQGIGIRCSACGKLTYYIQYNNTHNNNIIYWFTL